MGNESSKAVKECPPYTAGKHPGSSLLPAQDMLTLVSLPPSILGQISADGLYYDYYGKMSAAYGADTMLEKPSGKAEKDFELWYQANPSVQMEVDGIVNKNMLKVCGQELPQISQVGGWINRRKETVEEKTMADMNEEQKKMVEEKIKDQEKQKVAQPSKPSYKKDMSKNMSDFLYDAKEWQKGASDKADRDQMVTDVFATLNNSDFSPFYKSAMAMKYVSQYFYKRVQHASSPSTNETEENNQGGAVDPKSKDDGLDLIALRQVLQKALSQKFMLINQDRVIQFKQEL